MNTTLKDKLNQLSPERRKRIEERTAELIAETNKITRPFLDSDTETEKTKQDVMNNGTNASG